MSYEFMQNQKYTGDLYYKCEYCGYDLTLDQHGYSSDSLQLIFTRSLNSSIKLSISPTWFWIFCQ